MPDAPADAQLAATYARSSRREADDARVKRLAGALVAAVLRADWRAVLDIRKKLIEAQEKEDLGSEKRDGCG